LELKRSDHEQRYTPRDLRADSNEIEKAPGSGQTNGVILEDIHTEAILGVPAITPSFIATLQAMEVLKILLNRGKVFRNTMVHVDLESGELSHYVFETPLSLTQGPS